MLCASSGRSKKINQTNNSFTIKLEFFFITIHIMCSPYIEAWNRDLQQTPTSDKVTFLHCNRHRSDHCTLPRRSCQGGVRLWFILLVVYLVDYFFPSYQYIMQNYQFALSCIYSGTLIGNCTFRRKGDKICLFGFSRGGEYSQPMSSTVSDVFKAYIARAVMGMLYKVVFQHPPWMYI